MPSVTVFKEEVHELRLCHNLKMASILSFYLQLSYFSLNTVDLASKHLCVQVGWQIPGQAACWVIGEKKRLCMFPSLFLSADLAIIGLFVFFFVFQIVKESGIIGLGNPELGKTRLRNK